MLLVGNRLAIKGDWDEQPVPDGRSTILLQPSVERQGNPYMPYTRSMLEVMEALIPPATTVVDLGVGNGMLSLAAAKLGATNVRGYENRPGAYAVAQGNVHANHLSATVKVFGLDFTKETIPFCDLILCNNDILETLKAAIRRAREALSAGGHFVCVLLEADLLELDATSGSAFVLVGTEPVPDRWVRADFVRQ